MLEKVMAGAIVGGVLGVLALIGSLTEGKSFGESLGMIPGGIIIGIIGVLWFYRNETSGGGADDYGDREVSRLQNKLRNAIQSATFAEQRGDLGMASHFRAEAAAIESQLRNLGA